MPFLFANMLCLSITDASMHTYFTSPKTVK